MNRKNIILFLLVTINCYLLVAQEQLNKLKAPSSPAASILGLQPTEILEPKSYEALETAIYSNFTNDNNISVPDDFALEFTPYWTKNHGLTIEEYLYPEGFLKQFIRNASFSIASTQNFVLGDSTKTNAIGLGFRTTFYFYNKSDKKEVDLKLTTLRANQKAQSTIGAQLAAPATSQNTYDNFWTNAKPIIEPFIKTLYPNLTVEELEKFSNDLYEKGGEIVYNNAVNNNIPFLQAFMNLIDEKINGDELYNDFKDYIQNRYGLSIDIAYSSFLNFPTNDFEFSIVPKQALWITPSYKFKNQLNFLTLNAVLRYEWFNTGYYERYFVDSKFFRNNFDYGISIKGEFNKFSLQFEAIGRNSNSEIPAGLDDNNNNLFRKESDSDFQYVGTFSYNLSNQINLSYSIGNRFEDVTNNQNTLVSFLGLNFGFGSPKKDDLNLIQYNK